MSSLAFDDSGIDSGDKATTTFFNAGREETKQCSPLDDLEVVFRSPNVMDPPQLSISPSVELTHTQQPQPQQQSTPESADESPMRRPQPPNTCRILQRKLELKVERAKRNYNLQQQQHNQHRTNRHDSLDRQETRKVSSAASLIPISRLPIPGGGGVALLDPKPLVDYKSDSSNEAEEISFFPAKLKNARRQQRSELSDTFSIQEMTIDSDLNSDDSGTSQTLELLPPMMKGGVIERIFNCFSCTRRSAVAS